MATRPERWVAVGGDYRPVGPRQLAPELPYCTRRSALAMFIAPTIRTGQSGRVRPWCSCNDLRVEVDAERVLELCSAVVTDDPADSAAAMDALCEEVRRDPLGHVELMIRAGRLADQRGEPLWEYEYVVQALRQVDPSALHRLFDSVPTEPSVWHPIDWGYYEDWGEIREVVDYLGEPVLSRAWHDYQRTEDDRSWWAIDLVMHLAEWADRPRRRRLLRLLADDADEQTVVDVGCGPIQDFVSDDADDLDWLEAECALSPNMRRALRHVWCSSGVTLATLYRLDAIAGEPLDRLVGHEPEFDAVRAAKARVEAITGPDWGEIEHPTEELASALAEYEREFLAMEPYLDRRGQRSTRPRPRRNI